MELTLESALSAGGLLGHMTYLLLVLSMALKRLYWIRLLVMASAIVGICYSYFMLHDPVGVFWETLLLTVNLVRLSLDCLQDRLARFSAEERRFVDAVFPGLSPAQKRRLLDDGEWIAAPPGMTLSRQGAPVTHLSWLEKGDARIVIDGATVARSGAGDLIGELTILDGDHASATTILTTPARIWRIEAAALRRLSDRRPEIRNGLDAAFTCEIRRKLIRSHQDAPNSGRAQALALG